MIEAHWLRIAGLHAEPDGTIGVVWLALDPQTNVARIYDAALFRSAAPAVIREGIAARGRRIPLAWRKRDKAFVEQLYEAGIDTLPDGIDETDSVIAIDSVSINQMLQSSMLRVDARVGSWLEEFRKFRKINSKVPDEGFPLMAATRHAVRMMSWARPETAYHTQRKHSPNIKVV